MELTSERPDGTWTWRAAGARQPKGVLEGRLLPAGAGVGDVLRAEADIDLDGITVTSVLPPKGERRQPDRLEILGSARDEPPPTKTLGDRRPPDEERRRRREGAAEGGPDGRRRGERSRPARPAPTPGDRQGGPRRDRRPRPPALEAPPRPRARKLRPGRVHRQALLAGLPSEQQPIAEQAIRGGMPAVRAALKEQNDKARSQGRPEAPTAAVLAIAEALLPRVRVAEWLDRADAALAAAEDLALADLRSVVVSADDVARAEVTREPAARLREILERRTEAEHAAWVADLQQSLESGRVVRALRLSSRPPRSGERLSPELAARLAEAAGAAMTSDIAPDRWATVLDAVAYSAVRRAVTPAGIPAEPGDELLGQVRKHAGRLPAIAKLFGVEGPEGDRRARPASPPRPRRIPPPPPVPPGEQAPARVQEPADSP